MRKRIGVLAVQGAFAEHIDILRRLDVKAIEIRQKMDLLSQSMDGIILPGGESTVMGKLITELDIFDDLRQEIEMGLPVFGTCAGMILLAKNLSNDDNRYLGTMDIRVRRNAYGRQLGSFQTDGEFEGIDATIPMTFIRAPYIESVNEAAGVKILARVQGNIVAARQKNMLVTSFHPELTSDLRIHKYFLEF
ncbi:MAG TPA: pyridoxal 5'-phosphate synthase glutaminase subunit PdxT [Mobilitalea sp.]|nr:pyridoxal 5'-phosphate synthase glutaminase subunit PdxT [Mobilitalea sp.]